MLSSLRPRLGLSPLARGTPFSSGVNNPLTRFIPAGAGNTVCSGIEAASVAVYPRWRGEHSKAPRVYPRFLGLSPLARGTLIKLCKQQRTGRFIPAGAGNTGENLIPISQMAVYPRWRGEH